MLVISSHEFLDNLDNLDNLYNISSSFRTDPFSNYDISSEIRNINKLVYTADDVISQALNSIKNRNQRNTEFNNELKYKLTKALNLLKELENDTNIV